jgi:hypothetical protein
MPAAVVVPGGMLVFRLVTAAGFTAGLTGAQMHPFIAGLNAFYADILFISQDLSDPV